MKTDHSQSPNALNRIVSQKVFLPEKENVFESKKSVDVRAQAEQQQFNTEPSAPSRDKKEQPAIA